MAELLEKTQGSQAALQKLQEVHAVSAADCQALRAALQAARLRAEAAEAAQASSTQELQVSRAKSDHAGLMRCSSCHHVVQLLPVSRQLDSASPHALQVRRRSHGKISWQF